MQIKTSLYTHQILALLIYPISDLSKKEQEHLIPIFCKKINTMFGDDFYKNSYVKSFLINIHRKHLLSLIKKEDTKNIIKWLSIYKKYDKMINFFEKVCKIFGLTQSYNSNEQNTDQKRRPKEPTRQDREAGRKKRARPRRSGTPR